MQNSYELTTLLSTDGTIRFVSPVVTGLQGYEPGYLEGMSLLEFVHPDDASEVRSELAAFSRTSESAFSLWTCATGRRRVTAPGWPSSRWIWRSDWI